MERLKSRLNPKVVARNVASRLVSPPESRRHSMQEYSFRQTKTTLYLATKYINTQLNINVKNFLILAPHSEPSFR